MISTSAIINATPDSIEAEKDHILQEINYTLSFLPRANNEGKRRVILVKVEEQMQFLADLTTAATAVWGSEAETVRMLNEELEATQSEYARLRHNLQTLDTRDPLVQQARALLQDDLDEEFADRLYEREKELRQEITDTQYEHAKGVIRQNMVDLLRYALQVGFPQAARFVELLMDGDVTDVGQEKLGQLRMLIEELLA